MTIGLVILIGADLALAIAGFAIFRSRWMDSEEGIPLPYALVICLCALGIHIAGYGVFCLLVALEEGSIPDALGRFSYMLIGLATGLVPGAVFALILIKSTASSMTNSLFGTTQGFMLEALQKARALVLKGDIDGAVQAYRQVAEAHPGEAEPLLAAGGVLETVGRRDEAADLYREVKGAFKPGSDAWVRANRRLSMLGRGANEADLPSQAAARPNPQAGPLSGQRLESRLARRPAGMDAARRMARAGEADAAIEAYRAQFARSPRIPRPLFEAASLLEREGRYDEAAEVLKSVLQQFRQNDAAWCEAAYRLANLHENHLGSPEMRDYLLREILKRGLSGPLAALARERLRETGQHPG